MKKDIQTKEDVNQLIHTFYDKVLVDETIGFIFTDVAQIDLEEHLPTLCKFWENILLAPNDYRKNVMQIHLDLNEKVALQPAHFKQWLALFDQTVDELFEGKVAQKAKNRAQSIALVMQTKMAGADKN